MVGGLVTCAWLYQAPSIDESWDVGLSGIVDRRMRRRKWSRRRKRWAGVTGEDVVVDGGEGWDKGREK